MPLLPVASVVYGPDDLLAAARALIDSSSRRIIDDPEIDVSCRAGCSACCSQAVPASAAEVRAVLGAIDRLEPDRRRVVAERIERASQRLHQAGVTARDFTEAGADPQARFAVAARYFEADVACPLLDDGVCSIRPDRPLACREYLVTSDPKHCAPPGESADQVVRIRSATDVVGGFAEVAASFNETKHYILAFALADAAANGAPERPEPQARSGPRTAALLTARTIAGSD